MFIVLGQIRSFPLICLFTFLLSLVNESFRPANSSAIAFYSKPENRTRSYSLNRLAVNLGWAVGTSLGGFIASYSYTMLFWVDGITNICATGLMFLFLKPGAAAQEAGTQRRSGAAGLICLQGQNIPVVYFFSDLFCILFFPDVYHCSKIFRDNLHLNEQYIGMIMALNGLLIVLLEMVLVYKLEGRRHTLHYIRIGVMICALSFFSLLIPGNAKYVTLLMIVLITVGEILAMPFMSSYWIARSNEKNRGQYAALYTIAWGIAQTTGPFFMLPAGGSQQLYVFVYFTGQHFCACFIWLLLHEQIRSLRE